MRKDRFKLGASFFKLGPCIFVDSKFWTSKNERSEKSTKKDSGRSFQEAWTESFGVIERNGKALCIICTESVVCRTSSVRRHFNTNHKSVAKLGETEKKEFLVQLRQYHSQSVSFCNYLSWTNYLINASFQISLCLAKHGKPSLMGILSKQRFCLGVIPFFVIYQTRIKSFNEFLRSRSAETLWKIESSVWQVTLVSSSLLTYKR